MLKYLETLRKHQLNMFWGFFKNFLKIRFSAQKSGSAQMSNNAKKYFETLRKHQLTRYEAF